MNFEWDDTKAISNLEKHSLDFQDVTAIFDDPATVFDTRNITVDGELRFKAFGYLDEISIIVVFT
jgi:uncharacterized DUF497 family protein